MLLYPSLSPLATTSLFFKSMCLFCYTHSIVLFFRFYNRSLTVIVFLPDLGFPGVSDCKESACNSGNPCSIPGLGRSPGKGMTTHSSILAIDRGVWWATVPGVAKTYFTKHNTHSSTLAWKISWLKEPGRLQSMGSQRVGHNWATSLHSLHTLALEKEMATDSSILAWRIPSTEEPGGLPSMGSPRVGCGWCD